MSEIEKYINKVGKECYRNITEETLFSPEMFHVVGSREYDEWEDRDFQVALHTNIGSLTVLDRMTGFGNGLRDTETGYRDIEGNFWLASGNKDVRESGAKTIGEAIAWVKKNANTCDSDREEDEDD